MVFLPLYKINQYEIRGVGPKVVTPNIPPPEKIFLFGPKIKGKL
jgi:hypothetical protein